jgi:NAD(P)-dependent dehydrogenase (short-subunit alcohol dehydrogenase family)
MSEFALPRGVVVVTGAAGGIGSQCARLLVRDGWNDLLLCDREAGSLESVAKPLRSEGAQVAIHAGEITDPSFIAGLVRAIGARSVAAVIHTAGIAPQMGDTEEILAINVDGTAMLVDAVRPLMAAGGAVLLYASTMGHMSVSAELDELFEMPMPPNGSRSHLDVVPDSMSAYMLSKRAVRALVRREAKAFGELCARIVSISPGLVDTVMTKGPANAPTQFMLDVSAVGRKGKPEELAEVSVFLISPKAAFVTGTDLIVDGGQTAGMEHAGRVMPELPR